MPGQKEEVLEKKNKTSVDPVYELTKVERPVQRNIGLKTGLNKVIVTREMYSLGTFSLEEKTFEGRIMPIVKITEKSLQSFNGAWIFRINDSIVGLCDYAEVQKKYRARYDDLWGNHTERLLF